VYDLSDHLPIFIILKSTKPRKTFYGYNIRDMSSFKANGLVLDLQEHLSSKLVFDNSTSINANLELLYKSFHEVLEIHAPLFNAFWKKKEQLLRKPWLTSEIYNQIKKKHKMFSEVWNKKIYTNTLSISSTEIT